MRNEKTSSIRNKSKKAAALGGQIKAVAGARSKRTSTAIQVDISEDIQQVLIPKPSNPGSSNAVKVEGNSVILRRSIKPESKMTVLEKIRVVRTGYSKGDLEDLKQRTTLDYDKLAKLLLVTRATLSNKKGNEKFSLPVSERILSVADLYSYGYEVFEDEGKFNQWMLRPNQALGGESPYSFCETQFGREEVKNIVGRIEYGVYS